MLVSRSVNEIKKKIPNAHVALGVFDGVHKGHVKVIQGAQEKARAVSGMAGVFTFPNHPMRVIDPMNCPLLLTTPDQKERLFRELGLDFLIMEPFTEALRTLPPDKFLGRLRNGLDLKTVTVGDDFRFGHGRSGGLDYLKKKGEPLGFSAQAVPTERLGRVPISSGLIRDLVSRGEVSDVEPLLGRYYGIEGSVARGDEVGRKLGFPTANLKTENEILPKRGVYVVEAKIGGRWHGGAANVGKVPTRLNLAENRVEVHLLDWKDDLYGEVIAVRFLARLREELRFQGIAELKEAIAGDVQRAHEFFSVRNSKSE